MSQGSLVSRGVRDSRVNKVSRALVAPQVQMELQGLRGQRARGDRKVQQADLASRELWVLQVSREPRDLGVPQEPRARMEHLVNQGRTVSLEHQVRTVIQAPQGLKGQGANKD